MTDSCLAGERAEVDEALTTVLDLLRDEELAVGAAENDVAVRESLINTFSHELRNLLNAMTVSTAVFLRREGKTRERIGANIRLTVQRMERLLTNMMELAKLNRGKFNVLPRPHDAAALVEEAVETFGPMARSRSVSLRLDLKDAPLAASIDHDRVFQVLANLLTNAIDFSEKDGKVAVRAAKADGLVQVAVEDAGPGIAAKELPRVFERYRQLDRPTPAASVWASTSPSRSWTPTAERSGPRAARAPEARSPSPSPASRTSRNRTAQPARGSFRSQAAPLPSEESLCPVIPRSRATRDLPRKCQEPESRSFASLRMTRRRAKR